MSGESIHATSLWQTGLPSPSAVPTVATTLLDRGNSLATSPQLVKAAHEFEASMMKELLAPLQSNQGRILGDDDASDSTSAMTEFASEALGNAISVHGGLGIAESILHKLAPSNHSWKASVTAGRNETASNSPSQ